MAADALGRWQVAIGLLDPSADRLPATGLHKAADLRKEPGITFLDPTVNLRRGTSELHARIFAHAVDRAIDRGQRFGRAIARRPEPDGIEVRLADEMECGAGRHGEMERMFTKSQGVRCKRLSIHN